MRAARRRSPEKCVRTALVMMGIGWNRVGWRRGLVERGAREIQSCAEAIVEPLHGHDDVKWCRAR
jgi:hypothetical protein